MILAPLGQLIIVTVHTYVVTVNIFGFVVELVCAPASLTSVNQDSSFKMADNGHCPFPTIFKVDSISVRKYTNFEN